MSSVPRPPSAQQPPHPVCDLCGRAGPRVRFIPREGVWLCRDSRACTARFNRLLLAELAEARWEPVPDDQLPL